MNENELKAIAEQLRRPAGNYAGEISTIMNEGNYLLNHRVIESLQLEPGMRILEVGMANGRFVNAIFKRENNITYTGIDFSEAMIAEARKINAGTDHAAKVKFMEGSVEELPFGESEFDVVFSVNTIYFWEPPDMAMQQICRVLKPHGQLVLGLRPPHILEQYPFTKYGFRMFGENDLRNLLQTGGFEAGEMRMADEPDFEMDGKTYKVSSIIVAAQKA